MPITELKIDQSFVRGIPGDGGDVAIVQAVLSMARYLNLRVVAEGVEKDEQFDFLVANGCQMVQGFLLARPVAADVWLNGWVA
jgi:EAL domain-containing protein (putative c-di-GMP-specific phosphodiesterase class I)